MNLSILETEPALVVGVVQAAIVVAVAFGAPIDNDQKVAILGATGAVLAVVGAVVTRSRVTPVTEPHG